MDLQPTRIMALLAVLAPLAPGADAQEACALAQVVEIGSGTPGLAGVPVVVVLGLPSVGDPAPPWLLSGGAPHAPVQLFVGLGSSPLGLPALGGTLWANPELASCSTRLGAEGESRALPMSAAALPVSACGLALVVQGAVFDSAAQGGVALTPGVEIRVGAGSAAASLLAWPSYRLDGTPRRAMGIGDLNGDGRADIMVPAGNGPASNELRVFRQLSDGSLAPPLVTPTPDVGASDLALFVDRDLDGVIDLTSPYSSSPTEFGLVSRKGLGNGSFGSAKTKFTASPVASMTVGDVHDDGLLDVIVAPWSTGTVAAIPGAPGLSLGTPHLAFVPMLLPSAGLALGDVDLDGALDLLALTQDERLAVLRGDGLGQFDAPTLTPLPLTEATRVVAGDLNGDGFADVVVGGIAGEVVTLLLLAGRPGGELLPAVSTALPGAFGPGDPELSQLVLADLEGDGDDELVLAAQGRIWTSGWGDGGALAEPQDLAQGVSFALGDMTGDGFLDLALQFSWILFRDLVWVAGAGDGSFVFPEPLPDLGDDARLTRVALLNGDEHADLVAIDALRNVVVLLGQGELEFGPALPVDTAGMVLDFRTSDLDGDGVTDLAVTHWGQVPPGYAFLRGLGTGGFAAPIVLDLPSKPGRLVLDDADLDGRLDVISAGGGGGPGGDGVLTVVLPTQADGSPGAPVSTPGGLIPRLEWLATGDLHGDGLPDLIGQSSAGMVLATGTGTAVFAEAAVMPQSNPGAPTLAPIGCGDADGDGDLDVIGQSAFDGIRLWLNDGSGAISKQPNSDFMFSLSEPLLVDVNRDGVADLVTDRGLWLGTGRGDFAAWQPCAVCGGSTADLDGDGDLDFVLSGLVMPNGLR